VTRDPLRVAVVQLGGGDSSFPRSPEGESGKWRSSDPRSPMHDGSPGL